MRKRVIIFFLIILQRDNVKSSVCESVSGDEDHEINVESGSEDYEEENEELDDDMCNTGTDNEAEVHTNVISASSASSSPSSTLPFSISRLLGVEKSNNNHFDEAHFLGADGTSLYSNSALFKNSSESIIYSAPGGVIKVPAHRPGGNSNMNASMLHQSSTLGSPFQWLAMDPGTIIQRNAAAAMLAKERLTGEYAYTENNILYSGYNSG